MVMMAVDSAPCKLMSRMTKDRLLMDKFIYS